MQQNKLLVICGPTATGKTDIALSLAKQFDGELISADSRQVYRGMDIGTGKDLPLNAHFEEKFSTRYKNHIQILGTYSISDIPVWMYDVVDPDEDFSVSQFVFYTKEIIKHIQKRNKLPILVGGTGLYIQALLYPFDTDHIPPDAVWRLQAESMSKVQLQTIMQQRYPEVWKQLTHSDSQNSRRLIRKVEIAEYEQTHPNKKNKSKFTCDILSLGLTSDLPYIYEKIDMRVDTRMNNGMVHEIETLLSHGYTWDLPSMSALGYKEWKAYAETSDTQEKDVLKKETIQKWKYDEHGYARRQMTWFRKQKNIIWFDIRDTTYKQKIGDAVRLWYT